MLQRHDTKAIRCANEQEVKEICKIIVTLGGKDLSRWWNNEPFGNGDFYIFFMKNFSYGDGTTLIRCKLGEFKEYYPEYTIVEASSILGPDNFFEILE